MDLRSIKPGLAAVSGTGIFHPTLVHPLTGEPLEAVGVGKNGRIWWPVMGGASIEEDAERDADEGDDDGEEDEGEEDDSTEDDDDEKDPKKKIAALEEEKDRHYKRRKKAEKERDALQAQLDALKSKPGKKAAKKAVPADDDADGVEEDDEEKTTLRADNEKAKADLQRARIENAFLRVNAVDWVNPGQVMTLLLADDDYEVEFDTNGNVDRKSLAAELKRFAKANAHLVKPKKPVKEGDDEADSSEKSSGTTMNGQRKGKGKKEPTREELARKFPALNL